MTVIIVAYSASVVQKTRSAVLLEELLVTMFCECSMCNKKMISIASIAPYCHMQC